ncbi:MAG: mechanosensitive ion channel family protein, partial [Vicinamibacteria bacterium]
NEQEIVQEVLALDGLLSGYFKYCNYAQNLGLDATEQLAFLDRLLLDRAASLAAHIDVAQDRVALVRESLEGAEGNAAVRLRAEQRALEQRVQTASNSLTSVVELMNARGLETTEYRQLLIRTTGNVTSDIFDSRVAFGLVEEGWDRFAAWLKANGISLVLKIILFLIIVTISKVLANIVERVVARSIASPSQKMPLLLRDMAVSLSSRAVLILGILIGLSQLGIELGPLLAGLGIAGFIVGFALQDTLSNFVAGVMILVYQPFDVGHVIEAAGVSGKVAKMSLVTTTITTFDNQVLIVPNGKIWGGVIRNKSAEPTRRVDLVFRVGHSEDIARAERILWEVVESDERVLKEPAATIKVHELGEWSVDFIVRPWVRTEDYFPVYWDLTRAVKDRFDKEGIRFPVPQRDVHVHGEERFKDATHAASTGD